jgi:DnaJ-class molecular chaperone
MKTCPDCNGDGVVDKGTEDEQRCPTCGGSGFVPDNDDHEEVLNTSARCAVLGFCDARSMIRCDQARC